MKEEIEIIVTLLVLFIGSALVINYVLTWAGK